MSPADWITIASIIVGAGVIIVIAAITASWHAWRNIDNRVAKLEKDIEIIQIGVLTSPGRGRLKRAERDRAERDNAWQKKNQQVQG